MTITLPVGTTKLSSFGKNNAGAFWNDSVIGAGSGKSIVLIDVPSVPSFPGNTNPFYGVMAGLPSALLQAPVFQGFTVQSANPKLVFGGFRVSAVAPSFFDVVVSGFAGTANTPPGETNHFNLWHCTNPFLKDCEADGQGVGALGFAFNNCSEVMSSDCAAHDMGHSHGYSAWQCGRTFYYNCEAWENGSVGSSGGVGFNWEQGTAPAYHAGSLAYANSMGSARFNGHIPGHILSGQFHGPVLLAGGALASDYTLAYGVV